jgi:regulator of protease activity HflC (stomatin/prohibitin superfamily)
MSVDKPTKRREMTYAKSLMLMVCLTLVTTGCSTQDIPPGNKGFLFDRTGALAFYTGGSGIVREDVLGPGTHYTGLYDEVKDVNCKDEHAKEAIDVLTQSDLTVRVDLRITYSADCTTDESLVKIVDQVMASDNRTIEPANLYDRYILPIIRESLRNRLATVTIEQVKNVRQELRDGIIKDLNDGIKARGNPIMVKILTVSDIQLPIEIVEKNRQIELARQEAEQEREKQKAAKFRLERELFEAQEDRKVKREEAEKTKEVAEINAERDKAVTIKNAEAKLEAKKREAEGIKEVRGQLTTDYLRYLSILKDNEVRLEMARSMAQGTKWYVGPEFIIPPGHEGKVAIQR